MNHIYTLKYLNDPYCFKSGEYLKITLNRGKEIITLLIEIRLWYNNNVIKLLSRSIQSVKYVATLCEDVGSHMNFAGDFTKFCSPEIQWSHIVKVFKYS